MLVSNIRRVRRMVVHLAEVQSKRSDQLLQERLGIGLSQYRILNVLNDHPGVKQNQIAKQLGQTEASISRQLVRIVHDELVATKVLPDNRRSTVAMLTVKGGRILDEAHRILDAKLQVFEQLDAKQLSQLDNLLGVLHTHFCSTGQRGSCILHDTAKGLK